MVKKTLTPYQEVQKPSPKTLARQADALSARMLEFLSNTPALMAANVLSGMLKDTSDPATRLAILTTRIQVLRARTIACRLGTPVDGKIKLGAVLKSQDNMTLPPEILDPTLSATPTTPETEEQPTGDDVNTLIEMKLLQDYTHQGFMLPEGAVFLATQAVADDLVDRGIGSFALPSGETGPPQSPTLPQYDPNTEEDAAENKTSEVPLVS